MGQRLFKKCWALEPVAQLLLKRRDFCCLHRFSF
jgi:hypothetical protein